MNEGEALTVFGEYARIPPPGTVHILVAGFACVDFSMLNNKRKELVVNLNELPPERLLDMLGGESSVTLSAILKYARHYRPPILILENILGASWPQITKLLQEIDYSVGVARLDTKHFYLPQTRQRGYLFCVSNRKGDGIGGTTKSSSDAAVHRWAQVLNNLIRPASSPVDEFLLKDNHPDLLRALQNQARESGTQWETDFAKDWSVCWGRYQRFRESKGLGGRAPYTHWQSGKVKPPEHAQVIWLQKQPNRVKDTFDCLYLLSAKDPKRNYDAGYKSRFPDASQNIDRSLDMAKFGIVGCITPNNVIFHTGKGRPPTGLELLRLQGMDSDRLLLSRETQRQLKDLAGNAMSTTVVGSAIVAALIAAFHAIDSSTWGDPQHNTRQSWLGDQFSFDYRSELVLAKTLDFGSVDLGLSSRHFCELAALTVRKCYCEGCWGQSLAPISQCRECYHTSCVDCGGNPVHEYEASNCEKRYPPAMFTELAAKFLPTRLRLQQFGRLQDLVLDVINAMIIEEKLSALVGKFQEALEKKTKTSAIMKRKAAADMRKISKLDEASRRTQKSQLDSDHLGQFHGQISRQPEEITTESHPEDVLKLSRMKTMEASPDVQQTQSSMEIVQETISRGQSGSCINLEESTFTDAILRVVFEDEDFAMLPPKRSHHWKIIYESKNLTLKLILDKSHIEWLLYAKPPRNLPVGSNTRKIFDQPIAMMAPDINKQDDCIWMGDWYAQVYDKHEYDIRMHAQGKKIPSWRAELGLKGHEDEMTYDHIGIYPTLQSISSMHEKNLQRISGSYRLLPSCGTATRSLYRQVQDPNVETRSLYLFLESLPNQSSELDEFVVSLDHERALDGETHRCIARISTIKEAGEDPCQSDSGLSDDILSSLLECLSSEDQLLIMRHLTQHRRENYLLDSAPPMSQYINSRKQGRNWRPSLISTQTVRLAIDYRMERLEGFLEPLNDLQYLCMMPAAAEVVVNSRDFQMARAPSISYGHNIIPCRSANGMLLKYTIPCHGRNPDGRLNDEPCQITELNQRYMQLDIEWLTNRIDIAPELKLWNLVSNNVNLECCNTCSPAIPAYVHRQMPTGGLMPMEDPEAVVRFLQVWKVKPVPMIIATRRHKENPDRQDICVSVNIQCLIHRLLAGLPKLICSNYVGTEVSWRIRTEVIMDRGVGQLGSLRVHDCTREAPLLYCFGSSEFSLRGDQARVFRWMIGRDTIDVESFREVVLEESVSTHLHWSIEAQAARTVVVRGGLCADHVGFGKTVVVLATIREHMHQARNETNMAIERGPQTHIPIRATLVLVPSSLTFQWADEIEKFWSGCTYLMINNMADLHKHSVREFQNADIVIAASDLFQQEKHPEYTNRIAEIAGVADPARFVLPRQYIEWSKSVNKNVTEFVQDYQNGELSNLDCLENLMERSYEYRLTTAQYLDPSKRTRGRQFIASQKAQLLGARRYLTNHEPSGHALRVPGELKGFTKSVAVMNENLVPDNLSKKRKRMIETRELDYQVGKMFARPELADMPTPDIVERNFLVTDGRKLGEAFSTTQQRLKSDSEKTSLQPTVTQDALSGERNFLGPIFNMFHFHRKVVDEISYLSSYQEVAIKAIPSSITWLLSGTARLRDPMDVKRLAALVGVHLGPDDDSIGHNTESNRKAVDDSRSDPEKIETSKVVHTEAWHKRRLLTAQMFLDRFARTNQVELPRISRVRVKEIIYPVRLPALHAALHHECRTLLLSEGFKDNVSFTGHGKHDRSIRLNFVLHNTTTIEEALIKAAFHIPRAEGYSMMQHRCHELPELGYQQVLDARADDVIRITRAVIRRAVAFVYWLEHNIDSKGLDKREVNYLLDVLKRAIWLLSTRIFNGLLDSDALDQLHRLHSRHGVLVTDYPDMTAKEARRRLDRLGKLVDAMVSSVRSFRFLKNAQRLQQLAWNKDNTLLIDDNGHVTSSRGARINGLCGHIICEACVRNLAEPICSVAGCGAGLGPTSYVHAQDLAESCPNSTFSSIKIQMTINIIKALKQGTQALVFCQWHDMNEILAYFLDKAGISTTYVRDGEHSTAQKVAAFKSLPCGHPNWIKVMILNPLSPTAAGHNLQNVSAVIFLSPLSGSSLDDYKSAYIQCVGRAARYGQKEIVKVYHLLASRSVEVNIHESRRTTKLYIEKDRTIECSLEKLPDSKENLAIDCYLPQVMG